MENEDKKEEEEKKAEPDQPLTEEEQQIGQWLVMQDLTSDDEFLDSLTRPPVVGWDHRSFLRLIWLQLTRNVRRQAIHNIYATLRGILPSVHETRTYFWIQVVDYGRATSRLPGMDTFAHFLLGHPSLLHVSYVLDFYTPTLIDSPQAAAQVVLPDRRPLPSILTDLSSNNNNNNNKPTPIAPPAPAPSILEPGQEKEMDPEDKLLLDFESMSLRSWSHNVMLQVMCLYLNRLGRKQALDKIFSGLERFQGSGYNLTLAYFWLQMLDFGRRSVANHATPTIQQVLAVCPQLADPLYYTEFYTDACLDAGAREMRLPDKKPLPNVVKRS